MSKNVLLVGEPMGLFAANSIGNLEDVTEFTLLTCGAELNVAIGLRRLDHNVTYMTKLGDDLFGRIIQKGMQSNQISTEEIILSQTHPTGFMFKSKVASGDPAICYFRKGSAASTLSPEDFYHLDFSKFDLVHITGITPALSPSARAASEYLVQAAKRVGCLVSFDPNLRLQLWPSHQAMAECINGLAGQADVFLPGIKEAEQLIGKNTPEAVARYYHGLGTKIVVVKVGSQGAYYSSSDGQAGYVEGFSVKRVIDTVGAGDGFAVGVLSGLREGLSLPMAVKRGCAIGAIQVLSVGDNDGLPTRSELEAFMAGDPNWRL